MSITIPQAGVIAGRAAQAQEQRPSDTGAALSDFGQAMMRQASVWKQDKLQTAGRRIQIDMAHDFGLARQEVDQLGDPAQIATSWAQKSAAIREKYKTGTDANGNPIVPPEIADKIDLSFDELDNRHSLALGDKAIKLTQSQQDADWIGSVDQLKVIAAEAKDPETLGSVIELGEAGIDDRVSKGLIDPAQGAKEKKALRGDIFNARSISMVDDNPQAFLDAAERGEFVDLGAEGLAQRKAQATGAIARQAARDEAAAKVEKTARDSAIGKRLDDFTAVYGAGVKAADEDFLKDPEVMANPKYPEAMAAKDLRDEMPRLSLMTVPELDAAIKTEKDKPKGRKFELERLKVLQGARDTAQTQWNTNGVEQARKSGLPVPDLPKFDPADPNVFGAALSGRVVLDKYARSQGYTQTQAMLTPQDKAVIAEVTDPKADVGPKVSLLQTIAAKSPEDAARVMTVLDVTPSFRRAAYAVSTLGDDGLAADILKGEQKTKLGTVNIPADAQLRAVFDEATGGAYDGNPKLKADMIAAASSLYANSAEGIDPEATKGTLFSSNSEAVGLFTNAVQRVAGARADENGEMTVGGVQEINGAAVSLPPGIGTAAITGAFDRIDHALRDQKLADAVSSATGAPNTTNAMEVFRKASVDGRVPDLGANPADALQGVTMERITDTAGNETDQYRFIRKQNGRSYPVPGPDGVEYRFRLDRLLQEAPQ